jgi:hypothetical protein
MSIMVICFLVGCQGSKLEREAGEMVRTIVTVETQLNDFDIRYEDYLKGTEGYFHQFVSYISETDIIFSYPGEDDQQILYSVGDTDSFTDEELLGVQQLRDDLMGDRPIMTIESYISEPMTLDESIVVFVKLVPSGMGEEYIRYHMFRLREFEEVLKVSSVIQFQILEQLELIVDPDDLVFELLSDN